MGFGIKSVGGGGSVSVSVSAGAGASDLTLSERCLTPFPELETPARFPLPAFRLCERLRLLFDLAPNLS